MASVEPDDDDSMAEWSSLVTDDPWESGWDRHNGPEEGTVGRFVVDYAAQAEEAAVRLRTGRAVPLPTNCCVCERVVESTAVGSFGHRTGFEIAPTACCRRLHFRHYIELVQRAAPAKLSTFDAAHTYTSDTS